MHLERLTDAAREGLEKAFQRAAELRHPAVEPEHLLSALLESAEGPAASILAGLKVPVDRLQARIDERLKRLPTADRVAPSDQYLSRDLSKVIDAAEAEAERRKDRYTTADELLLGHIEQQYGVQRPVQAIEHRIEALGLRHRAYDAVQDRAPGRLRRRERLLHDPEDHVVRDERAGVHEPLGLEPQGCPSLGGRTQDVTSGELRNAERRGQELSLGPLARAGGTQQHDELAVGGHRHDQ